ncbi:hypothetical protein ACHAPT_003981 [Fusarium lateritium]
MELYKEAGRKLNWAPLFIGAMEGDLHTIERCLEAGAPIDYQWPGGQPGDWWVKKLKKGARPLHLAMAYYRADVVEWMLARGASPHQINGDPDHAWHTVLGMTQDLVIGKYVQFHESTPFWKPRQTRKPIRAERVARGWRIFNALMEVGASTAGKTDESLIERLKRKRERWMETIEPSPKDRLSSLPRKILDRVWSHLSPCDGGASLVATSRYFYDTLVEELYKEAGRQLNWLPLFIGAMDGNERTLRQCLRAGAPIDHQWTGDGLLAGWPSTDGIRPLHVAIHYARGDSVEWLLDNGANPSQNQEEKLLQQHPSPLVSAGWYAAEPPPLSSRQVQRWRQVQTRRRKRFRVPDRAARRRTCQEIFNMVFQAGAHDAELFQKEADGVLVPSTRPYYNFHRAAHLSRPLGLYLRH